MKAMKAEALKIEQTDAANFQLNQLSRQASAQVTALQGRFSTLEYLVNEQDPKDPEYIERRPKKPQSYPYARRS